MAPSLRQSVNGIDENAPLLKQRRSAVQKNQTRILITMLTLATFKTLGLQMFNHAQVRIFESVYCKQWYRDHPYSPNQLVSYGGIAEHMCKIPNIQKPVNTLRGNIEWWDALPGFFLAIPVGVLVDQVGRIWLFRLNVALLLLKIIWTAFVCAIELPLQRIYLVSILNLFCGGHMAFAIIFSSILADVTPQHKLANIFFFNNALAQVCKITGPAITGVVMRFDPWYTFVVIIPLLLVSSALTFTVPETMPRRLDEVVSHLDCPEAPKTAKVSKFWPACFKALRETVSTWKDWRLMVLLAFVPLQVATHALEELVQRYVSYKYGWTLGDVAFLHSMQAAVAAFVLFFVLPWISSTMDKRDISAIKKNVILLRLSFAMLVIAFSIQGTAPTIQILILGLMIETLGSGVSATLRALVSVLTGLQHSGRVFSGLATADAVSIMIAFPSVAALFNIGLDKDSGIWLGLPFWSTASIMTLFTAILCSLSFESPTRTDHQSDSACDS